MIPPARARLLLLDDDLAMLESIACTLRAEHDVEAYPSAAEALVALEALVPDVIVSDVVMPGLGGFEFRRRYVAAHPERRTPFLFLSSLGDPETVTAALEAGADDYVVKPVAPALLAARVRALLRRSGAPTQATFRGDLARLSFAALLELCEAKRFSGELLLRSPELEHELTIPVHGGTLDEGVIAPQLDRLCALQSGSFVLRASTFGLERLDAQEREREAPTGRLSSLQVNGRTLEVQTELVSDDVPMVVSLVLVGGEPVAKIRRRAPLELDGAALQALIDAQHAESEATMQDRISAMRHRLQHGPATSTEAEPSRRDAPEPEPPSADEIAARVSQFLDEGLDRSRVGDWDGALDCWERAMLLDPENRTLAANVHVAQRKLRAREAERS